MSVRALEARVARLEETLATLAAWLVSAQTGFGEQDYKAINRLIRESQDAYSLNTAVEGWDEH